MELRDTIEMMNSTDYKERFVAEYLQTRIRYSKLYDMLIDYKAGILSFAPRCSQELLTIVRNEKGRIEAPEGGHDDQMMGLAIAHHIRDQVVMLIMAPAHPR